MRPFFVVTPSYRVGVDLWRFVFSVQKQLLLGDERNTLVHGILIFKGARRFERYDTN